MAVFLALKYFLQQLRGNHVLVQLDNTMVVVYKNRQADCVRTVYQASATGSALGSGQVPVPLGRFTPSGVGFARFYEVEVTAQCSVPSASL